MVNGQIIIHVWAVEIYNSMQISYDNSYRIKHVKWKLILSPTGMCALFSIFCTLIAIFLHKISVLTKIIFCIVWQKGLYCRYTFKIT